MDNKDIPDPKLSATVLLVRDREALEVLMVRRHYQIDFASGALVFPGGKASTDDQHAQWDEAIDGEFAGDQQVARIAAVREAFEESGILLARPATARGRDAPLVGADIAESLAPHRAAVDRGEESFLELIRANDLVLALDTLVHFGHWITPTMMPKRFDTHFFLAPAPPSQLASHDGRETTDAVWLNADDALAKEAAGEATIIFPTRMNLKKLSTASNVAGSVEQFSSEDVVTVLPEVGTGEDGKPCLHIPEVAGYGQTAEPLERIKV
ncbi:MAG: NUDIX hydrolase [Pseudomonadota bacterium]